VCLETDLGSMKESKWKIALLAASNGLLPFIVGYGLTLGFGFDHLSALIVGTVFISSSVAIIIPSIKAAGLFDKHDGQLMVATIMAEDVLSLIILAIVFQGVQPISQLPLPLHFAVLLLSMVALKLAIPRIAALFFKPNRHFTAHKEHEDQLRFVIILLMAVLLFFSYLGVHPILAAFLVGLLLSNVVTSGVIYDKIHTLAYGLFTPVFFFIVGMEMDLGIFLKVGDSTKFLVILVVAFLFSKVLSGYYAARAVKISKPYARFFGVVSTPQLTTTLAATYAASSAGLLATEVVTVIIALSIVTTVLGPSILLRYPRFFGVSKARLQQTQEPYREKGEMRPLSQK